jgi:hypothetical protein
MVEGYIVQDFARPQCAESDRQSEFCAMVIGKMCKWLCNVLVQANVQA